MKKPTAPKSNVETPKEVVAPIVPSAETEAEPGTEAKTGEQVVDVKTETIQEDNTPDPVFDAEVIEEVPVAEEHVFEKPVHASEKAHYETILKSNKEVIASLRKQVIELRNEVETLKSIKE